MSAEAFHPPVTLPGPPEVLHVLSVVSFVMHVIFLNVVLGGSALSGILCLTDSGGRGTRLAREISRWNIYAIVMTVMTGLLPFALIQAFYGRLYWESVLLMGSLWIVTGAAFIAGTASSVLHGATRRGIAPAWVVGGGMVFLLVGVSFTVVNVLSLRPDILSQAAAQKHLVLKPASLLPRFLHFFTGALAFSGYIVMMVQIRGNTSTAGDAAFREWAAQKGLRVARWTTVAELGVGVWFLVAVPENVLLDVLGKNTYGAATLGIGMLLAIALIMGLFGIQDPVKEKGRVTRVFYIFLLVIVGMVLLRDAIRGVYLRENFGISHLVVQSQWEIITLYIAFLWMILASTRWVVRRILGY